MTTDERHDEIECGADSFPLPNEQGEFSVEDYDIEYAPRIAGVEARICLVEQKDGWRGGAQAILADATFDALPLISYTPFSSREEAITGACEALIGWCGEQKGQGGKKHRRQAEELQSWAIETEKREGRRVASSLIPNAVHSGIPSAEVSVRGNTFRDVGGSRIADETSVVEVADPALQTSAIADGELKMVSIEELHESPWNPRQYYPEGPMAELVESMRTSGYREWLPLMVRPALDGTGYEIGAGHRRSRAARIAGIGMVPCIVRPMTDAQLLDVLNFDNAGRDDVHPLHEAAGWRVLMERTGIGVLDIARRLGKSKEYVYQGLKYGALIASAQRSFLDGEISSGHAILIARCDAEGQEKALRATLPTAWNASGLSVRELKAWIKKNLHLDLSDAPFPLDSADLVVSAGSCAACPYRVGNLPDFDPVEDLANGCGRPGCYDEKVYAHVAAEKIRLQAKHGYLICVSVDSTGCPEGVLPRGEWHRLPNMTEDPAAKVALAIDGDHIGQEIRVLVQERLALTAPEVEESKRPTEPKPDPSFLAAQNAARERLVDVERKRKLQQERDREEAQRQREMDKAVRLKLLGEVLARVTWPPQRAAVERILGDPISDTPVLLDEFVKSQGIEPARSQDPSLSRISDSQLARLLIIASVSDDFDDYSIGRDMKCLGSVAKSYGVDIAAVQKTARLEHTIQASGIDFSANVIECRPGKAVLADIRLAAAGSGWHVTAGVSLPVKAAEGYGASGPVRLKAADPLVWPDRGAAIDAAFAWMLKFLGKVPSYSSATDATRAAEEQVRSWVKAGRAARAAIVSLQPPVEKPKQSASAQRAPVRPRCPAPAPKKVKPAPKKKGGKK